MDDNELKEFASAEAKQRKDKLYTITASLRSEGNDTTRTIDKFLAEK